MYLDMKNILACILAVIMLAGCGKPNECEREIYFLPEAFKGNVIVFFDQEDGAPVEYKDDARVYHIPESGYLKSQFPKNGGCMNDDRIRFFYTDGDQMGAELDYFLNIDMDSIPTDHDYVLFTFLSSENEPHFVIHLIGNVSEFHDLTEGIRYLEPIKILDSL
jgi:hypothetical protein